MNNIHANGFVSVMTCVTLSMQAFGRLSKVQQQEAYDTIVLRRARIDTQLALLRQAWKHCDNSIVRGQIEAEARELKDESYTLKGKAEEIAGIAPHVLDAHRAANAS